METTDRSPALYLDAYRKLSQGAHTPEKEGSVALTYDECAVVVDRLYQLREVLENLVGAAETRTILSHTKPDVPAVAELWVEKISAFVTAVENAREMLDRG